MGVCLVASLKVKYEEMRAGLKQLLNIFHEIHEISWIFI